MSPPSGQAVPGSLTLDVFDSSFKDHITVIDFTGRDYEQCKDQNDAPTLVHNWVKRPKVHRRTWTIFISHKRGVAADAGLSTAINVMHDDYIALNLTDSQVNTV
jgi:hypothetical protein